MKKFSQKTGKHYWGGYHRPSPEMIEYKNLIHIYRAQHKMQLENISKVLTRQVELGWVLRVDCFIAFHEARVFSSPNKKILQIDGNNRIKPLLDGVVTLLGIDDSVYFRGDCEKVTTAQKESECTMVRIQPVRPRTLQQIHAVMMQELKDDGSTN